MWNDRLVTIRYRRLGPTIAIALVLVLGATACGSAPVRLPVTGDFGTVQLGEEIFDIQSLTCTGHPWGTRVDGSNRDEGLWFRAHVGAADDYVIVNGPNRATGTQHFDSIEYVFGDGGTPSQVTGMRGGGREVIANLQCPAELPIDEVIRINGESVPLAQVRCSTNAASWTLSATTDPNAETISAFGVDLDRHYLVHVQRRDTAGLGSSDTFRLAGPDISVNITRRLSNDTSLFDLDGVGARGADGLHDDDAYNAAALGDLDVRCHDGALY